VTCLATPVLVGTLMLSAIVGAVIGVTALALVCVGRERP
jgi:hypothetical protein